MTETLATAVREVERQPLDRIPPAHAARIRRRIVDHETLTPRLDVAAFSSAP